MAAAHIELGKLGEELAAAYLLEKGYKIVAKNYRSGKAEIDIIALLDNMLIFIEVKTRRTSAFGFPEEAVTAKKKQLLFDAAANYIHENNWQGELRFDIISLILDKKNTISNLTHFEDAFFFL